MTTVVAGILERDGRILICQRKANQAHPLKWEFPGGKVEGTESPEEALVRELREELGVTSAPGSRLTSYEFSYPGKNPILLIFLAVTEWQGDPENLIFERIVWEPRNQLRQYDFLEGDAPFLETHLS